MTAQPQPDLIGLTGHQPQRLSRRRLLTVMGVSAAAVAVPAIPGQHESSAIAATGADSCADTDTDEQEVGPFFADQSDYVVRSDITAGEDGIPLDFSLTFTDSESCSPLIGAAIYVWHANALGVYSDEASEDTTGDTYLRGIQITDDDGAVSFTSVYPGWYSGRTQHIHYRVYTGGTVSGTSYDYSNATLNHTGQLFFDPDINAKVATTSPYDENTVTRTTNAQDRVYTDQHGSEVLCTSVTVAESAAGTNATGLSIHASATTVKYGEKLTLSGVLSDTTTAGTLADHDVTVTAVLPSGKKYSTVVETGDSGEWTVTTDPKATATYIASYTGTSTYAAATSSSIKVPVHQRVSLADISGTGPAHKTVTVKGKVHPERHGDHVTLHQVIDGKRHTVAHARTDRHGEWTARLRLTKGKHHLVATVAATEKLAAGTSRTVTVRRT